MSLKEAGPDLRQAKNWTPKTLAIAALNTLMKKTAREIGVTLNQENAELNDFWTAEGRIKKVNYTSLVHYICSSGLLKNKTESELSFMLYALFIRISLESQRSRNKKLLALEEKEKGNAGIMRGYDTLCRAGPTTESDLDVGKIKEAVAHRIRKTYIELNKAALALRQKRMAA